MYSEEFYNKVLLDIASRLNFSTLELFALKYNISEKFFGEIKEILVLSLAKGLDNEQIYTEVKKNDSEDFFNRDKYNELLHSYKCELELYESNDGLMYKRLCKLIKNT